MCLKIESSCIITSIRSLCQWALQRMLRRISSIVTKSTPPPSKKPGLNTKKVILDYNEKWLTRNLIRSSRGTRPLCLFKQEVAQPKRNKSILYSANNDFTKSVTPPGTRSQGLGKGIQSSDEAVPLLVWEASS